MMRIASAVAVLGLLVASPLRAGGPEVKFGGLFYAYNFFWQNADFNAETSDGDMFWYMHGDVTATATFDHGVMAKITVGTWGAFGQHTITGAGPDGTGNGAHLMEAYLEVKNLFETPLTLTVGKKHVLYGDGLVLFDGGEDGLTQVNLNVNLGMFSADIFNYRVQENGAFAPYASGIIGTGDPVDDDIDILGVYGKLNLQKFGIEPYYVIRTQGDDQPAWMGARLTGQPIEGLSFAGEFVTMGGSDTGGVNYKGMAYLAKLDYSLPMGVSLGGGYYSFSGDDPTTEDNELYEAAMWNPFTNGFWQWWPGFGPAHTMRTAYGFVLLAPFDLMTTNLNVINAHAGYAMGDLSLRADFWMYSRNQVGEGESNAMGNEISLLAIYNYAKTLSIGAAVGYWMPGDYFTGQDPMLGGHIFVVKGF